MSSLRMLSTTGHSIFSRGLNDSPFFLHIHSHLPSFSFPFSNIHTTTTHTVHLAGDRILLRSIVILRFPDLVLLPIVLPVR
ncbi:hypothetical protein QVD17_37310 [Tagetes erecta]|uniref:Uncharacterized protein n=1 Tax=Tagetes erecta TaxID=13708 RepID=A0AAD8JXZ7_TARER|nr:hypothetical protein QVD17_37310 [Tagetes erecta]